MELYSEWEETPIGSGSFGMVKLWVNKMTNEQVAVKICRLSLGEKERARWNDEVRRMRELHHPNVVATRSIPPPVQRLYPNETVLCMEYCSGGDLRDILMNPANSCGLPSGTVMRVLHDVSSAVEYLHTQRIIHRDLKPENVVLQRDPSAQHRINPDDPYHEMRYKLIDLGYAKKLDAQSLTTSFVGTVQYLAPELLESDSNYTFTADFWSFGTLAFETMVGRRPFFPGIGPVQWYHKVAKKRRDDICGYDDLEVDKGGFSPVLPRPTQLCEPLRQRLVLWLRSMLRFEPRQRGGYVKSPGRSYCFQMLDEILSLQLVTVFNVSTLSTLTYTRDELQDSVERLQRQLFKDTNISADQQELLTGTGEIVEHNRPLSSTLSKLPPENCWLFLIPSFPFVSKVRLDNLPSMVRTLYADPNSLYPNSFRRPAVGQSVFVCENLRCGLERLVQAYKVVLLHLLRLNLELERHVNILKSSRGHLTLYSELLARGVHVQLEQLQTLQHLLPVRLEMDVASLRHNLLQHKELARPGEEESYGNDHLEVQAASLQARMVDLQRSPVATRVVKDKEMGKLLEVAHKLYTDVRKQEEKKMASSSDIHTVIQQCYQRCDLLCSDMNQQWIPLLKCRADIQQFLPHIQEAARKVSDRLAAAERAFLELQRAPWQLLQALLKMPQQLSQHQEGAMSMSSGQNSMYLSQMSVDSSLSGDLASRLHSLLDWYNRDSGQSDELIGENRSLMQQLSDMATGDSASQK